MRRAGGQKSATGETILAKATDRDIEIALESLSPNTTRPCVSSRRTAACLYDSATATEIILQTEKALGKA